MLKYALALCAALAFSGCSQAPPESSNGSGEPPTLQLAGMGKSVHPFWEQVELGMQAGSQTAGANVEFFVPSREDAKAQSEKLKSWVVAGKQGILFAASDPETVGPAIRDAIARGIPCIAMDTDAPQSGRIAYVGTDNYAAGREAGKVLGQILQGRGKVCIATGSLTAANSLERIKGFQDALEEEYPGVVVLRDILVDNEDRASAVQKAKAKLAAEPDISAFYGVYALNGPACATAVESAGKTGQVKVVCFDTTAEHMNMLKSGKIDAAIGQRPFLMGRIGVELLAAVIRDGAEKALVEAGAKDGKLDTGVDIVMQDTIEEYREKLKGLGIPVEGW